MGSIYEGLKAKGKLSMKIRSENNTKRLSRFHIRIGLFFDRQNPLFYIAKVLQSCQS